MHPANVPFSSLAHALDCTHSHAAYSPWDTYAYVGHDIVGCASYFPQPSPLQRGPLILAPSANSRSALPTSPRPMGPLGHSAPAARLADAYHTGCLDAPQSSFAISSRVTPPVATVVTCSTGSLFPAPETTRRSETKSVRSFSRTSELRYPSVKPEPRADYALPSSPSPAPSSATVPPTIGPQSTQVAGDWIPSTLEELLAPPAPKCVPLRTTGASPEMRRMMGVFRLDPFARHDGVHAAVRSGHALESDEPNVRLRDRAICWNGEQAGPLREESAAVEFQVRTSVHRQFKPLMSISLGRSRRPGQPRPIPGPVPAFLPEIHVAPTLLTGVAAASDAAAAPIIH